MIISSSSASKLEVATRSLSEKHPNGSVKAFQLDVRDPESIRGFLGGVGKFDHLVCELI